MKKTNFLFILVLVLIISAPIAYAIVMKSFYAEESIPTATPAGQPAVQPIQPMQPAAQPATQDSPDVLPPEFNIDMTFYSQAPYGNWKQPWQDSCEEASMLLIANAYNKSNWTRAEFNDEILKLVKWEVETYGYYKENEVQQIVKTLKDQFSLSTVIHTDPTFEDVQTILAQGHLIILPLAGKEIGNPNFQNGGPTYHVIVAKGYKEDQKIITEDVGTSHGENYIYSWDTLKSANHDYIIPIDDGAKVIIEVLPPQ